jgi:hypothetical protein
MPKSLIAMDIVAFGLAERYSWAQAEGNFGKPDIKTAWKIELPRRVPRMKK